jgi:hypothetical protein
VTFTLEPSADGVASAPECRDCAKVVKNSLSLSAVLVAVAASAVVVLVVLVVPVAGVAGVVGEVADDCRRLSTLLKAANRRVTPRLGAGAAVSVLGTVFVVAVVAVAAVAAVVWVTGVVFGVPDAPEVAPVAAGGVPKDCASCSKR